MQIFKSIFKKNLKPLAPEPQFNYVHNKKFRIVRIPVCGKKPVYKVQQSLQKINITDDTKEECWRCIDHECFYSFKTFTSIQKAKDAIMAYCKYLQDLEKDNIVEEIDLSK